MTVSPRLVSLAYAIMRIFAGLLFAQHGAQKLFGVLGGKVMTGNPLMMTAGIIEFVGGLLIAIGLLTRVAAFLASGEMAVAYFKAHAPQGFWPVENQGELVVLYCFVFLFIAAYGGGIYSLDHALRRRGGPSVRG
jgi:putative oxidoreductase